ncbi:MAG: sialidase family protein [Gemmatimonadaceae bacterium]
MRCLAVVLLAALAGCGRSPSVAFGDPEPLNAGNDVGAAPMVALSPSGARTVAWVSAPGGGSDGRLYVTTDGGAINELRDSLGGIEPHGEAPPKVGYAPNGTLYALYAVAKVIPGRRFPFTTLRFSASSDGGRAWSAPQTVASDSLTGSRNFHALHVAHDGWVYVAWLESGTTGESGTYLTSSPDGGATWRTPVRVAAEEACPCCRTAIATARDGTVHLAWRSVAPGNVRDIVVATSSDRGATWSTPSSVHADNFVIDGCPHAGPSMHTDSAGRVHIAWWTGARGRAGVYYARSDNGARAFGPAVELSRGRLVRPSHVQLALDGAQVAVAWDDGVVAVPKVLLRVSRDGGGSFGGASVVSDSAAAGMFPVLMLGDGAVTVAWSQHTRDEHERVGHQQPDMKDPSATMPLPTVGTQRAMVRRGVVR